MRHKEKESHIQGVRIGQAGGVSSMNEAHPVTEIGSGVVAANRFCWLRLM